MLLGLEVNALTFAHILKDLIEAFLCTDTSFAVIMDTS